MMIAEATYADINRIFTAQQLNKRTVANTDYKARVAKLRALENGIMVHRQAFKDAMYADFKKHPQEVDLTEISMVLSDIRHTISHLRSWMKDKSVSTPMTLIGTSSWIQTEAKGACLIISPWNYPINLTLCPLVYAIAAGNTVMIKPSEITPNTSGAMAKMIAEIFDENEVAILQGEANISTELLILKFDHIFFTGSPAIGKVVMRAAAEHLTSVTLELGGKSPIVIDETADLKESAHKLVMGKFINNGQTCIAPDYLMVHENVKDAFVAAFKTEVEAFYGKDLAAQKSAESYCRIVSPRHYARVKSWTEEAILNGGKVVMGAQYDDNERFISPTLLENVPYDASLCTQEVFGPVLTMRTFKTLEEVVDVINDGEKPLAMYIMSRNEKNIKYLLKNTSAGGTCINETLLHFANQNLPFGGVNNSGIGKTHGIFGFAAFSNERAVMRQHTKYFAMKMLLPPYSPKKQWMVDLLVKWL
jgi:aldehyde dehydrogenase (NAD+)